MSLYLSENFLLKTSDNKYYNFYLSDNYGIAYNYYINGKLDKTSTLIEKEILDFSVAIDKYDRIHLIYLTKEGKLLYYIYSKNEWTKYELTKFNLVSNKIKYLTLHLNDDNIHVFYIHNNIINKNIWTINHISVINNKWRKQNIISFNAGKYVSPFYVNFDHHNNIHLIYKSSYDGAQHIYYTSYSSFLKKWNHSPQILSNNNSDNSYPYPFVDERNTVHVIWCSLINSNFKLIYKQLPYIQSNTYRWHEYEMPNIQGNIAQPIMFEEDNILKILIKHNGSLKGLYSKDYGYNWILDDSINNLNAEKATFIRYYSNFSKEKYKTRINHTYGHIEEKVIMYYNNNFPFSIIESSNSNKNGDSKDNLTENQGNKKQTIEEQKIKISKEKENFEEQNKAEDKSPIIEELDFFNDEYVKQFITNTKSSLDSVLSKTSEIKTIKEEIENIIIKNSQKLDNEIVSREIIKNDIINDLNTLENMIYNYKVENEAFLKLLNSIRDQYEKNSLEIEKLESRINEIKKIAEKSSKSGFLQKIVNYFK